MPVSESDVDAVGDSVFTEDPCASDSSTGGKKRQLSVTEMARKIERKKQKNMSGGRKSPTQGESASSPAVTLEAIKELIQAGNDHVISALDKKFAQLQQRIEILESEKFERDQTVDKLARALDEEKAKNRDMAERLESIDANRRLSSLILTCNEFGLRTAGENIIQMAVDALNKRMADLDLKCEEIQGAHRLEDDHKVIVKFLRRHVRDSIFERRFELSRNSSSSGFSGGRFPGAQQPAPLYLAESLTPPNQLMFRLALAARKAENGEKLNTVFTRRGRVICRKTYKGENIRLRDIDHLRNVLGGVLPQLPERPLRGGGRSWRTNGVSGGGGSSHRRWGGRPPVAAASGALGDVPAAAGSAAGPAAGPAAAGAPPVPGSPGSSVVSGGAAAQLLGASERSGVPAAPPPAVPGSALDNGGRAEPCPPL